jgi:alkylresorcinol/alkylpyrone synthase
MMHADYAGLIARIGRMQEELAAPVTPSHVRSRLDVEILSVATANPPHRVDQGEAVARVRSVFPHLARLEPLYANTGIETRYSCEPYEWCQHPHGWVERTRTFQGHAVALLEEVAAKAVGEAGLHLRDIDMLVLNTVTGLAVPSLDAMLMNRLPFANTVERLPMFGLGCGAGVAGLARAARLAHGAPGANVLFLTVDLCSLCARPNDPSVAMFVCAALFGDGAAGVVLRAREGRGASEKAPAAPRLFAVGEHFWHDTGHIMGWDIKEDGFGVVLSPELPGLLRTHLRPALDGFLYRNGLALEDFRGFLLHPGSSKLLEVAEDTLGVGRDRLAHSWSVLRDYGNMSSATALFVLRRALDAGAKGRHLLAAFGPGFSAYFLGADL